MRHQADALQSRPVATTAPSSSELPTGEEVLALEQQVLYAGTGGSRRLLAIDEPKTEPPVDQT